MGGGGSRLVAFDKRFHLVDNLLAALAGHLGVRADGDHVLVGGEALEVDGGGVFAEGLVVGEVVGGGQLPAAVAAEEAEVAGVVVEVAGMANKKSVTKLLL